MDIAIRTADPTRVAALPSSGEVDFAASWNAFIPAATDQGFFGPGVQIMSVFRPNYDPETGVSGMQSYAPAITVAADRPIGDPFTERMSPTGKYAAWTYTGPYEGLAAAWGAFVDGVKGAGHRVADREWFEIYLDDPSTTPPESLRTVLHVPVE
ncbi:MAG TPA: GyrI-like domain-containing protein [bacterium]|nr:GyrI-like domain-containing protein [bacterium]